MAYLPIKARIGGRGMTSDVAAAAPSTKDAAETSQFPDVAFTNGTELDPAVDDSLYCAPLPFGPAANVYPAPTEIVPAESQAPAYTTSPAAVALTVDVGLVVAPVAAFDRSAGLAPQVPANSEMTMSRSATEPLTVIVTVAAVTPDAAAQNTCVRVPLVAFVAKEPAIGVHVLPCESVTAHVAVVLSHAHHVTSKFPDAVGDANACASVVPAAPEKLPADCA
jgi:hypothetical protein